MDSIDFELNSDLANDSLWILDLPLCQVHLMKDSRFFWALLVPRLAAAHEWFTLGLADQQRLHLETMQVARALKKVARADKINIGALGNVVPQLHVHVVARNLGDACWPGPVWGTQMQVPSDALMQSRSAVLLAELEEPGFAHARERTR